jgi:hypothetical protein
MSLFWLLCVSLVVGGLVFSREVRAALGDLRLQFFGVRVRVTRPRPGVPERQAAFPAGYPRDAARRDPPDRPRNSPHDFLPPPRVVTRAGP